MFAIVVVVFTLFSASAVVASAIVISIVTIVILVLITHVLCFDVAVTLFVNLRELNFSFLMYCNVCLLQLQNSCF